MLQKTELQIQNNILYEKLRDFIMSSFEKLNEIIKNGGLVPLSLIKDIQISDNSISTFDRVVPNYKHFIFQYNDDIKQLPELGLCIEWMLQDSITKKMHGKNNLDGNPLKPSDIRGLFEMDIIEFLSRFVEEIKSFNYSDEDFIEFYKQYEDYLYAKELKFKSFSHLENFQCELDEIDLGDNLKIRKYSKVEIERLWHYSMNIPLREILYMNFFIEIVYSTKKGEPLSHKHSNEIFNKFISCMRLLKSGNCGFNMLYEIPLMWSNTGISAGGSLYKKTFLGEKYELNKSEIERLRKFWNDFKKIDNNCDFLSIAIRRFNYAYERKRQEDKLIDYITAFEALFSEGSGDLRYKIPIRVARLLETDIGPRKKVQSNMKAGYDARSNIVHGNKHIKNVDATYDDGSKKISLSEFNTIMEEYLRKSINEIIRLGNYKKKEEMLEIIDFLR